jgi:integrase
MSESLHSVLDLWASNFPKRRPGDYLIPSERYGQPKRGETAKVYATDPTHPLKCYKYAWAEVRERAGISARFHDLRHTGCTALLESGVSFPICAEVMGWSASTAILLAKTVYGNIGIVARQQAIAQRDQYQREQALLEARQISRQVEIPATPTIQ